ncbi:hypothetical protein SCP_0805650 [Sparassis crispa]|uniref:Uncharacterized protein n=1 Tax=Sparassis crispa TaxID=139825 RepID=A0A401GUX9_9APHY|nr:hypothetical protein SCP_0805650 [Sparassis crispa]GBE86041.1 hypothetical protein SCP_0805650 [Sparassis crispa]
MGANQSSSGDHGAFSNPDSTLQPESGMAHTRYVTRNELSSLSLADVLTLGVALREMSACDQIFKSWNDDLDSVGFGRETDLEIRVRHQISTLQDRAQMALSATERIVETHECFSQIMVERLRRAAESGGRLTPDSKVLETANSIKEHSAEVSRHVGSMCETLRHVMDTLDETQKRTPSLKDQILTWLRKVLQALTVILQVAAVVANIFVPNGIWASGALAIGSFVSSVAEKVISEMDNRGMINGDFQQMLRFFREKIPQDVQRAADSLQVFDACHQALRLELEIQERELLTVDVNVARQAEEDWKRTNTQLQQVVRRR